MKVFGIERRRNKVVSSELGNVFNKQSLPYSSLGDEIIKGQKFGVEQVNNMAVQYDAEGETSVDVLTSPDHDYFDIVEQFNSVPQDVIPAPIDGFSDGE